MVTTKTMESAQTISLDFMAQIIGDSNASDLPRIFADYLAKMGIMARLDNPFSDTLEGVTSTLYEVTDGNKYLGYYTVHQNSIDNNVIGCTYVGNCPINEGMKKVVLDCGVKSTGYKRTDRYLEIPFSLPEAKM
jgi:hypothetical protein